ncbi:MAG: tetratricopeptide repeat protein [Chroococcus sp. CMT-3BRIN-NPC107]|jgi:tetratricopeptide (TPR) repeat protein|nr:tetratricopeptide repeat protein [Chroococcus sp. CMT-3BRIN-NPC107]
MSNYRFWGAIAPSTGLKVIAPGAALKAIALSTTLLILTSISPTLAADPFRTTNPRPIGDRTEAAFKAIFQDGNYKAAQGYLKQAQTSEPQEPLAYAMQASLAYGLDKDLAAFNLYGNKTLETAKQLISTDALRGNLYAAVGYFLQGASVLARDGTVRGTPEALSKLRLVYEHLDKAQSVSANDPEINLMRGYMDLLLAVNLPFSNPEQAIARLEKFAAPQYLAARGLAIGYRDLEQYSEALAEVNRAINLTPNNPELFYLKAQILAESSKKLGDRSMLQESIQNFDKAISKKAQLPTTLVKQMERERSKAASRLINLK